MSNRTSTPTDDTGVGRASASAGTASPLLVRLAGAALCLAVAAIHVIDQGGFPGSKDPAYVGIGYYALEFVAVLTAVALLVPAAAVLRLAWVAAMGVAAGPFVGYVLSRGPGLPGYSDDRGNWTEPLGLVSLAVEAVLFVLAVVAAARLRSAGRPARTDDARRA